MDKKDLLRLLNQRVKEIEILLNSFDKSAIIHDIENDILLSKIRILYEEVKLLTHLDSHAEESENIKVNQPLLPEPPETNIYSEPIITPDSATPSESIKPSEPFVPQSTKPTIGDKYKPSSDTHHSPFPKNPNGNLLTGVKMQAVNDIMVAIGLNDRFLFTRELFNNDNDLFNETIKDLNQRENWDTALAYLNEHFDWDSEDPTLVLFLSFIKRRYI